MFLASLFLLSLLLWGALVAWAWLGDRPNGSRVVGLVIGFVGVAALAWDKASFSGADPMSGLAVLACLTATLLYDIAASFTKKYLDGTPAMANAAGNRWATGGRQPRVAGARVDDAACANTRAQSLDRH